MTRDLSVTVFGQTFAMPIGLSPTARQKRWTSEGEVATVKGSIEKIIAKKSYVSQP